MALGSPPDLGSRLLDFRGLRQSNGMPCMARSSPTGLARSIQELLEGDESVECDEPLRCCDGCLALHFAVSLQEATDAALKLATAPGFRR